MLMYLMFSSGFLWSDVLNEMSCDTYKYGIDPAPLISTIEGDSVKVDSFTNSTVYGKVNNEVIEWNEEGICSCNKWSWNLTMR